MRFGVFVWGVVLVMDDVKDPVVKHKTKQSNE